MAKHKKACAACGCHGDCADQSCPGGCSFDPVHVRVCSRCTSSRPYLAVSHTPGNGGSTRYFVMGPFSEGRVGTIKRTRAEAERQANLLNRALLLGREIQHAVIQGAQNKSGLEGRI